MTLICPGDVDLQVEPDDIVFAESDASGNWRITGVIRARYVTRKALAANRTYYVRTDGNDNNDGLANTAGGAFATLQKAWDTITKLDLGGFTVTVQIGNGTYTAPLNITVPQVGGIVQFLGDATTPANVLISATSADCVKVTTPLPAPVRFKGIKLQTTTIGSGIAISSPGAVVQIDKLNFGACAQFNLSVDAPGSMITLIPGATGLEISGSCILPWRAVFGGKVDIQGITVTLTGTPAFSFAFASATNCGSIAGGFNTFSGSATGPRYVVSLNGVISSAAGGASYFPGDSAGSAATGGQYS